MTIREKLFQYIMECKARHSAAMLNAGRSKDEVRNSLVHQMLVGIAFHLSK